MLKKKYTEVGEGLEDQKGGASLDKVLARGGLAEQTPLE